MKTKKYPIISTFKRIISEAILKDRSVLRLLIIYTIVASIFPLFAVYIPKVIIQELLQIPVNVMRLAGWIIGFTALSALFGFIETWTRTICNPRLTMLRIDYLTNSFDKLNRLDYHYSEDPTFLDSIEDALNAVGTSDTGFEGIYKRLFFLFARILTILFYIIIISQLSYWVLLALVVSLIVSTLLSVVIKRFRYRHKEDLAHAGRKIRYYSEMTHDFSYGKDIRLYRFQDKIQKNYHLEIANYVSVFQKIKNKEYGLAFIELLFVLISDALLYYVLISRVLNGLSIADFSMYLVASVALSTLFKTASEDISFLIGEGQYINDYYLYMETEYNAISEGLPAPTTDTLEIVFDHVSFKYPKTDKWIIKDLNLTIKKGEKLAIVGINGAGKTTLVKLLLRFFVPTEGVIYVNGINIQDYDKQAYLDLFAAVFQDINILAVTVRENITLGHSSDDDRIWDCLEQVGLKDKIKSLKHGLDQHMLKIIDEEGAILSGGENQKLAIARALYKNAKSIILDEPTAALDPLAEAEIYQHFNQLVHDRTTLYISHRLASTKFCDKIALFKDTQLIEYGSHEQLMQLKGEYHQMFVIQGKYYQEEYSNESN